MSNLSNRLALSRASDDPLATNLRINEKLWGSKCLTTSAPSLVKAKRRMTEFSLPFGDPSFRTSIRRVMRSLLLVLVISPIPSEDPESNASSAKASSVIPAFSSINILISKGSTMQSQHFPALLAHGNLVSSPEMELLQPQLLFFCYPCCFLLAIESHRPLYIAFLEMQLQVSLVKILMSI